MRAQGETGEHDYPTASDLSLPRSPQAPRIAREATRELCERLELSGSRCQTLLVLVSEIVTNAVRHSDGPRDEEIAFRAEQIGPAVVRVDVVDGGSGFEPTPRDPSRPDGGWGLYLVDRESQSWGVEASSGTRVWFAFRLEEDEPD
jgi:anti-sigma regulatory factor (Ser/Thr protein kinase)